MTAPSRNQACDKGAEQGFAASAGVVHDLEEAEIEWQLVLRDARCGRSQERSRDRRPSTVLTWTSQKPSPSSSRAYSLRPWQTVLCQHSHRQRRMRERARKGHAASAGPGRFT